MTSASFSNSKYAIVGGGLMGRLLAVALAKGGAQVDLFDKGGPDGSHAAARIAAAMLAPLAESAITEDSVVRMGLHSLPRWKELIANLSSPVYFQQVGTLILWHRQDASEAERFAAHLDKNCRSNADLSEPQKLNNEALRELEPGVADRFTQGLYLPNEGQLDNRQLLDALASELTLLKVNCHWHTEIEPSELRKQTGYKAVIDCRGTGAKEAWSTGDKSNNLRGVRGEVIRLYAPEVKLRRPTRLIHPRYPIYIAPKENDVYVVGATEIESDDLSEMSVRSAMELLSAVYTVHSGFAEARILEMATHCRPTLKNNLPEIRSIRNKGLADLIMINGLYRHGFMISPAVLDCALELLEFGTSKTALDLGLSVTQDCNQIEAVCA
ncbi:MULTISPECIES: FAD-dependent oxidoreductase [unclassified Polynucleobacter]|jgi:glycine oxidase|uniref:FAD-dependent oxidoreductase n=1 Tax=unclassified Polynucleobacter TaxID=2640945 RepID=UPI001C0CDA88|nr:MULTISPECIES: FAD-dependent oxidoreductase [unclassified Polynucleobacter]MBU3562978.1 FAD-dependent oxidoreductase [Polynucleobacter sp. Tro8-14-1]MBU3640339.1 FAD-dependent oxidoreductase [Polynucleobacter sp. Fuers-14]MEA9567606.1 FAD-dependent oxidoreductase [Polynucleobacter sp. AP-Nickl1-40-C4]